MEEHRTMEWTCSEVLHLIREYGHRPALWDPDCEDYKNRFRKHHKYMELAAIFKCSKLEVERKMKILNSQYRRERLKAIRMKKLGQTHRITWYGYKAFGFMNKHWVRYKNRANLMMLNLEGEGRVKQENEENELDSSTANLMPLLEEEDETDGNVDDLGDEHVPSSDDDAAQPIQEYKEGEHLPRHKDQNVGLFDKDECVLFGELVAHALKKFDDRTRCVVKHKINTVLYEAEIASFQNS